MTPTAAYQRNTATPPPGPDNLERLLQHLSETPGDARVTLDDIMQTVGRRSFGPVLLIAGLITLSPIGDVPGTPTIVAILVVVLSGQVIAGRGCCWLPGWLLRRSVKRATFEKSLQWLRRPAKFVDRFLQPRLQVAVRGAAVRVLAALCLLVALSMPILELIPFSATLAGIALTAYGLALIARDGLMAILASAFIVAMAVLVTHHML